MAPVHKISLWNIKANYKNVAKCLKHPSNLFLTNTESQKSKHHGHISIPICDQSYSAI